MPRVLCDSICLDSEVLCSITDAFSRRLYPCLSLAKSDFLVRSHSGNGKAVPKIEVWSSASELWSYKLIEVN